MKTVNKLITLYVLLSLVFSLVSCADPGSGGSNASDSQSVSNTQSVDKNPPRVIVEEKLDKRLYASSETMVSRAADVPDFEGARPKTVDSPEFVERTVLGHELRMHVSMTAEPETGYAYILYSGVNKGYNTGTAVDRGIYNIKYKADSKEILSFTDAVYENDSYTGAYQVGLPGENSPSVRFATEEELVAYARQVMEQTTGISVEGWEAIVYTGISQGKDRGILSGEGYINNYKQDDTFSAEYTVTFNEKMLGISKKHYAKLQINPDGVITDFESPLYEELYVPFKNAGYDLEAIESLTKDSENTLTVYNGKELWIESRYSYKVYTGNGEKDYYSAGTRSVIKLASLEYD